MAAFFAAERGGTPYFERRYLLNVLKVMRVLKVPLLGIFAAAGVTDHLWEIGDIVALVEAAEAKPAKRGPYKTRNAA